MVGVTNASPASSRRFASTKFRAPLKENPQVAALADQVQIVTPDTAQPPLAIQLPERAKGMVDHHRHDRMRGEPTLFRRRKRHPGLVETQAPPGAPTAQQFVAVAPIDTRQGSIEDREQRLIPGRSRKRKPWLSMGAKFSIRKFSR